MSTNSAGSQGFITVQYARNVHFQIKNGQNAEFNRVIQTDVLPLLKKQKGFQEELTLVNREGALGISIWEDRNSAEEYNRNAYPTVLQKLNPVLEGTPRVETFEVAAATFTS